MLTRLRKRLITASASEDVEQLELSDTADRSVLGRIILENCLAISTKAKYLLIIWLSNSTPRYLPKRNECVCPPKDISINILISFIHSCPKLETIHMSINREWISKLRYWTNTETAWMAFPNIILSKKSQTQKIIYVLITFIWKF